MNTITRSIALACLGVLLAVPASSAEKEQEKKELIKGLSISGLVEVEGSYFDSEGESSTDLILSTFELGFEANVTDWLSAYAVLLYEEDGDDELIVDEAYIRMKKEESPIFAEAGRMTQAFGNFATGMISDPLTLELGETKHHASLRVGYEADPLTASIAVMNGDVQKIGKDDINTVVASIGAAGEVNESFSYGLGASYISNIGDTDGLQESWPSSGNETSDFVAGYSVYGIAGFGDFEMRAEYLAAAEEFQDGDAAGSRPQAYNLEVGYDFPFPMHFALRYAGADDFAADEQYGATLAYDLAEQATVALEYLHQKNDDLTKIDMVTLQLAMGF
ncbi:MAG: LbtU family siderophore porin [Chlorobium sp.]|uniref:LbtU family siderophore porin n=1 Tax=Chlorobium sp. TaxID=1095 RepID=UPI0025BB487E|nr:LbtU family siderophore porin [Chlorobium sp.]MCF8216950.1 LbtU family siderophore porin [Chlorobium sp.]MCF8271779.1 LbtU family siderophore porin [Chlorobium sp.]MCF8288167.1 LbtU family siderophore porin [Chlorobium sp.]MCF8291758.1 LbtU family siderophore porin [Chlorobium sp.]MCF8385850.1 LbtU family siderophore porin [Chlorobium sp.]